ncbi:hypothetical protein M8C13_02785 [Crossiella sp. SN42]|uniref:hypothetical protein n=1 Tax=Crossiella sp. SN42 TaxID=2944808 RepID=UPI00207CB21C|nr:hypothetical protein [Crossiella sp. SN42]MCO1574682.1 hypothetical protein [Crossiella sp. SN42]
MTDAEPEPGGKPGDVLLPALAISWLLVLPVLGLSAYFAALRADASATLAWAATACAVLPPAAGTVIATCVKRWGFTVFFSIGLGFMLLFAVRFWPG